MRLGEVVALQWSDLDYSSREIRIERRSRTGVNTWRIQTPKSGHGRTVDLSPASEILKAHECLTRLPAAPEKAVIVVPDCFPRAGKAFDGTNLRRVMRDILKKALFPLYHPTLLGGTPTLRSYAANRASPSSMFNGSFNTRAFSSRSIRMWKMVTDGNKGVVDRRTA